MAGALYQVLSREYLFRDRQDGVLGAVRPGDDASAAKGPKMLSTSSVERSEVRGRGRSANSPIPCTEVLAFLGFQLAVLSQPACGHIFMWSRMYLKELLVSKAIGDVMIFALDRKSVTVSVEFACA